MEFSLVYTVKYGSTANDLMVNFECTADKTSVIIIEKTLFKKQEIINKVLSEIKLSVEPILKLSDYVEIELYDILRRVVEEAEKPQ